MSISEFHTAYPNAILVHTSMGYIIKSAGINLSGLHAAPEDAWKEAIGNYLAGKDK